MSLPWDRAAGFDEVPSLAHGFFHRRGGVSTGLFASLNCGFGSGDEAWRVAENRRMVAAQLGVAAESLLTVKQVHSARVVTVQEPWAIPSPTAPEADAMVTNRVGFALGVLTADCAPLLFCDPRARVIGAAHAGWKGAFGGIAEATLDAMVALGAEVAEIRVAIGPCIAQVSYEVGAEFRDRFLAVDPALARYFVDSDRLHHYRFDLAAYLQGRLGRLGLAAVESLGHDTCANSSDYFSYRRSCLNGEPNYGRLISAIVMK